MQLNKNNDGRYMIINQGIPFLDFIDLEQCIQVTCNYLNNVNKNHFTAIIVPEGFVIEKSNKIKSNTTNLRFKVISKTRYVGGSPDNIIVFAKYGGKIDGLINLFCLVGIKKHIMFLRYF